VGLRQKRILVIETQDWESQRERCRRPHAPASYEVPGPSAVSLLAEDW